VVSRGFRNSLVVHYWISIDVQNSYTMAPLPADDKVLLVSDHTFEMKEASERHYGIEDEQERQGEEKHGHGSTSLR
jgi:hypothetical protein